VYFGKELKPWPNVVYLGSWLECGDPKPGLINLCILFLDAQSTPNKGSVDAQNKAYAHYVSHATATRQEVHVAPPHIYIF
jgi:hypothetical protein